MKGFIFELVELVKIGFNSNLILFIEISNLLNKNMEEIQIIMLGNPFVGKTNIILQYSKKEFKNEHICTLGVDFLVKDTSYGETPMQLQIWDTNGNDRFTSFLPKNYYRSANGILLVCSYDDKKSYNDLEMWINNIKEGCQNSNNVVIAINKSDLDEKFRCITKHNIEELQEKYNFPVIEVSAKNDINIDILFNKLIELIMGNKYVKFEKKDTVVNGKEFNNSESYNLRESIRLNDWRNMKDPDSKLSKNKCSSGCCSNI